MDAINHKSNYISFSYLYNFIYHISTYLENYGYHQSRTVEILMTRISIDKFDNINDSSILSILLIQLLLDNGIDF